jgi:hypothetical protein
MTSLCPVNTTSCASAGGGPAGLLAGTARGLQLAAAPTFAAMALLSAAGGGGASDILCAAVQDASPLTGMIPMYLLMSVFHAGPWLRLLSR